jgi:tRNA modification GTPase
MISDDTIAAISTPSGVGGISIIRLSGGNAIPIVDTIFRGKRRLRRAESHSVNYGRIVDPKAKRLVDEVLVTVMKSPRTYTREDIVEINCHGGTLPTKRILEIVLEGGARLAEPGEFTKRAFLNGRIDLNQAEAVLDVVNARTEKELACGLAQLDGEASRAFSELKEKLIDLLALIEAHVDFPEEELPSYDVLLVRISELRNHLRRLLKAGEEGRLLSEGLKIAIVGRPNVGKSSLLNALLTENRAIVTPIPGTTRDALTEWMNIGGYPVKIVDTAGLRRARGLIESESQRRTEVSIESADIVLVVLDCSDCLTPDDRKVMTKVKDKKAMIVLNKRDISTPRKLRTIRDELNGHPSVEISATERTGLNELKQAILNCIGEGIDIRDEGLVLTSARQRVSITKCAKQVERAGEALQESLPPEIVALEVREAIFSMDEATGKNVSGEVLDRIFSRFCIGK